MIAFVFDAWTVSIASLLAIWYVATGISAFYPEALRILNR